MSKQPLVDQLDEAIGRILADPGVQPSSVDASLVELLAVARDLRQLPEPEFKARLRVDLERKISMSTKVKEVVFRPGFRTVTPYLLTPNAEYIDFLKGVFGGEETERTVTSPASFHSELRIGDSMLMLGMGSGRSMPATLHVYVQDADEVYQRALGAGATSTNPMGEAYGERFGCVLDKVGNQWIIATHLGGEYPPAQKQTITTFFNPVGAGKFIDFLKQAFGAEEWLRYDSPEGEVVHAKIRIGDSVVAVGEAHDRSQARTTMMYLYVPNVDALYEQALRAGAKSLSAPADQRYGDRSGGVTDAWGNQWYMATPL